MNINYTHSTRLKLINMYQVGDSDASHNMTLRLPSSLVKIQCSFHPIKFLQTVVPLNLPSSSSSRGRKCAFSSSSVLSTEVELAETERALVLSFFPVLVSNPQYSDN